MHTVVQKTLKKAGEEDDRGERKTWGQASVTNGLEDMRRKQEGEDRKSLPNGQGGNDYH